MFSNHFSTTKIKNGKLYNNTKFGYFRLVFEFFQNCARPPTDNDATGALSRTPLINYDVKMSDNTSEYLEESYCVDKLDIHTFPLTYRKIDKHKCKDKEMIEKLKCANDRTKYFC